jgi:hypothetical protein
MDTCLGCAKLLAQCTCSRFEFLHLCAVFCLRAVDGVPCCYHTMLDQGLFKDTNLNRFMSGVRLFCCCFRASVSVWTPCRTEAVVLGRFCY